METQGIQLEASGELVTSIDDDGGTAHVTARGELDIASSAAFGIELAGLVDERGPDVVVDVSGLTFCDARGLAALVAADELARRHGGAVTLIGPRPQMAKILRLTGLDRRFASAR
ncbi:STAS domain-containing protein [Actinomadura mexicana]|uniref:Anti-sigma factor antagonist n=1 Tax=Actinomadura mexicana TaxID=134959 RepID=A0A239BVB8_9ACTN|nr:STAS domain-containing protein [Actinomadura mexicana]SNS11572.1 anti-anti-sigma factor [Actinomadura mexicana]